MAGRPPKPTAILKLKGTVRPCRMKKRGVEPAPVAGLSDPPDFLLPEAKAEWHRVCSWQAPGILAKIDRSVLAAYCQMWARFVAAESAEPYIPLPASFFQAMLSAAGKLGLEPSSRVRFGTHSKDSAQEDDSPWANLTVIDGGKKAS